MVGAPETPVETRPSVPRYQPLVIVLVAACAGIVADRFRPLPLSAWWTAAAIAWIAWLLLWRKGRDLQAAAALMLAVAAVAGSWHHCRWYLFPAHDLGHYAGAAPQPVCIEAIALSSPRPAPRPQRNALWTMPAGDVFRFDAAPAAIRDGQTWQSVAGRAKVAVMATLSDVQPGDRLRIFAHLGRPPVAQNPGEFDYAAHLRGDRTRSELRTSFAECVSVIEPGSKWGLTRWLEAARMHGNRMFAQYLDPRRAALADAVLLGQREQVEPEVVETFMETGTIHLLVISGLHVGILAWGLSLVFRYTPLRRGWALAVVAAATTFYALMVDAEPPVVRATVLVLVACWSVFLHRSPLGFNTLAAAALVVLFLNPADLFHTGAQLSFLCVVGLIWAAPRLRDRPGRRDPLSDLIAANRGWPNRAARYALRKSWSLLLIATVVWLMSAPLVMARFHLFTPIALVMNTIIWVPIEAALLSGMATLVLGTLAAPLGQICGAFCNSTFALLEWLVTAAHGVPGGHFWMPGPADWWLAGFYGGLGLLAAFPRWRPPRRWCVAMLALWSAVGFGASWLRHAPARLDCTLLAMGHGCAVAVELPSGQTLLYDAGKMGSPVSGTRSIAAALWSRGITHLDAVVLSHGDVDHYNALPGLLDRFSVGVVYVSPVMFENENAAMRMLREAIDRSGVAVREIRAGDRLLGGPDCSIEVLHPPRHGVLGSDNANSVVLAVEHLGHRILLPGDLESPGMDDLLAEPPTACDVLLVPHHGSRQSNSPALAAWSAPRWVVISGSHRWDTRPVEAVYRAVGGEVLHTADLGAISVRIDNAGVKVESFLPP